MITFNKPLSLNGEQLRKELNDAGIVISDNSEAVSIDENDLLVLDIKDTDKIKAEAIVAAHNGTQTPREFTVNEKLASVGLSLDDLKAALGL
jgi:hypothetical protein